MPFFDMSKLTEIIEGEDELFSDNLYVEDEQEVLEAFIDKINAQKWCLGIYDSQAKAADLRGQGTRMATFAENPIAPFLPLFNNFITEETLDKSKFQPGFLEKVKEISARLQIPYMDLLVAMSFETGGTFSPAIRNKRSGATGLIQFMPSTAKGLGTTTEKLAVMSQVDQLDYVEKYLKNKGLAGKGFSDIYMSILFPVAVGKPMDFVLFGEGAISDRFATKGYTQNNGLDKNKDGKITKEEAVTQAWLRGVSHIKIK